MSVTTQEEAQELIDAVKRAGSLRAYAKIVERNESVIRRRFHRAIDILGLRDEPEFVMKGQSTLVDAAGNTLQRWDKTKQRGRQDEEVVHLPDPKTISKISTHYDQMGEVTQQWISEKPDDVYKREMWLLWAHELAQGLPRITPIQIPDVEFVSDLCSVIPVGDHHMGMLAWKHETGASYDLDIGEQLLAGATEFLVRSTPHCETSVLAFLGDFMHYDSFDAVTPTSKHRLDSDGRFPKMVRATIRAMRRTIEASLAWNKHVHVIIEIGNHDLASSIFLMEAMANIYEKDPRVTIDTSPRHFHYYLFGKNLLGTHHGHGAKPEKLPLIMAADQPEWWGQTSYRLWLTGHIHHRSAIDFTGCTVESFRVLPPTDAWAANNGYRSHRDMKALLLHREHGEVARYSVNPSLLDAGA